MLNTCGQYVGTWRMKLRKDSAKLSTDDAQTLHDIAMHSAEPFVSPTLSECFTRLISPAKTILPPLIEHYFYPVSTAPTNNYNQKKIKER